MAKSKDKKGKRPLHHFKLGKQKFLRKRKFTKKEIEELKKRKYVYIYAFRHSITNYNARHIFTGCLDSVLTKRGHKEAEKIAKQLRTVKFEVAYTSHLKRAKETLRPVLKYHPEVKEIIEDDRVIERCYGDLERHSKDRFEREHPDRYPIIHRSYDVPPPHGESIKMVEKRVMSFLKELLQRMKKEKINVAISCHGNSLRPMRKYFEHLSNKEMMKLENPWDRAFVYKIKVD